MTNLTTNFSLIKLIGRAPVSKKVHLRDIFDAVINGKFLDVDESHIKYIFEHDLTISISKLDKRLIKVLTESLIYYMTIWPGWRLSNEYLNNSLQYGEWFEQFRRYLSSKSNFVIKSASKYTKPDVEVADQSTQTEREIVKKVAPYTLFVGGPPAVLNNIVFVENNGDILIKQHMGKAWKTLCLLEFLNWTNVSVEVKLPEFSFTRTVSHVYDRFIGLKGDTMVLPEIDHIIHIKKLQNNARIQPYSYNFFQSYIFQLNKTLQQIPFVAQERLVELRFILSQFLVDVEEINVHNNSNITTANNVFIMSTNTSVGFHIGNSRYLRNKKMVSNSNDQNATQRSINFYEVISPQIDLALLNFEPVQDLMVQPAVAFKSLSSLLLKCTTDDTHEDVTNMRTLVNESCITYACTLCKLRFEGPRAYNLMMNHFETFHKSEQSVLCYKCGKQFELKQLAGLRWKHPCRPKK